MSIHVSLPKELESRVHEEVASGMYGSVSEVVREALRDFFSKDEDLSYLRKEIQEIQARLDAGTERLIDGEQFFTEMDQKLSTAE